MSEKTIKGNEQVWGFRHDTEGRIEPIFNFRDGAYWLKESEMDEVHKNLLLGAALTYYNSLPMSIQKQLLEKIFPAVPPTGANWALKQMLSDFSKEVQVAKSPEQAQEILNDFLKRHGYKP